MDSPGPANAGFAARCLLRGACWATLATQSEGQPATALVTHAVAPDGAVLMLLSSMSEHARQLSAEPRCALMVTGKPENLNWQTAPRLSVSGTAERLEDAGLRRHWVARHPYARLWADFTDFSLWRLIPAFGHYVAGFGRIRRLTAAELACPRQAVEAVSSLAVDLVRHCNTHRTQALSRLAHAKGHSGHWMMGGIDPDGFDLVQDEIVLRIAFDASIQDGAGLKSAMAQLLPPERRGLFHA